VTAAEGRVANGCVLELILILTFYLIILISLNILSAFTRTEMAHPQEDDHTNLPLQDPGRFRGSVLGEKQDPNQQVAEGSRIQELRCVSLHHPLCP